MPATDVHHQWIRDMSGGQFDPVAYAVKAIAAITSPGASAPIQSGSDTGHEDNRPKPSPTQIPTFTGSGKEKFAQECALLDSFKPSSEHPDMYSAIVNGNEASVSRVEAERIIAQVSKQMRDNITNIAQYNHSILTEYEKASATGLEHIGSGLNEFVSFVKGDGWIHDPGDKLEDLQQQWLAALSMAGACVQVRQFAAAARHMADGEILGLQADHLFTAFENHVQKDAGTTLSVLRHVESASKAIAKTIATAEFGKAGAAAVDATFAAADVAGEALAGHDIDWSGHFIDLGMDVLMDKFGDQAEGAVKNRLTGMLESKFKSLGKKAIEKIAEKVAKKVVSKGSDLLKTELHSAADAVKKSGKKATYTDLAKATVDAMQAPNSAATAELEAALKDDHDYAALVAGYAG
jgi:hypothetical protein